MAMHGPWHPILHNAYRPQKQHVARSGDDLQYASAIPNDYSWYRPLDKTKKEIRILFLEPEPPNSPKDVVVHVFNASLLEPKIIRLYGCLSYCWGDPKKTKVVQVMYSEKSANSSSGLTTTHTPFQVTANLDAALRVLRSTLQRPVMWVDALCIDQSDVEERNSQVPLMSDIYFQAVQTVIWLGEADSTTKAVFDFADFLTDMEIKPQEIDPQTTKAGIKCGRLRPLAKGEMDFLEHEIASDEFYKIRWGIQSLLARPFFRRAWVVQEVGLADTNQVVINCGMSSLWWRTFQNLTSFEWRAAAHQGPLPIDPARNLALSLPMDNLAMKPGSFYRMPEIWSYLNSYRLNKKRGKVLDLIFRRLEIQATDPRDQVFAILGLAQECEDKSSLHPGFCADYTRDVANVYTLFTCAVIEKVKNLVILSNIDVFETSPTRKARGIPSWVPEYDRHINIRQTLAFLGEGNYCAAGNTKPVIEHVPTDPKSLFLAGMAIDAISQAHTPRLMIVETSNLNDASQPTHLLTPEDTTAATGIYSLWLMAAAITPSAQIGSLLETFILTLMCARRFFFNRELIYRVDEIPNLLADFASYWVAHGNDFASLPNQTSLYKSHAHLATLAATGQAGSFGQRLSYTCDRRAFFVTKNGHIGIGPRDTRSGDMLVVFKGGNVPFVVRKLGENETPVRRFELIGECYLHGVMQGGVMDELETGALMVEMMCLC